MPKYTLRDYQQECVSTVDALPEGARSIVALATGLGKTVCFSRFDRHGGKMLILSHREELVRQPEKYFEDCTFGIEQAGNYASLDDDVVSASVQTFSREGRFDRFPPDHFDTIVVDEAHHAAAPTYKKILKHFTPKKLIGMTATPRRGDGVRLDDVFDSICFKRDIKWGIKNGYLSNIMSKIIHVSNVDLSDVEMQMGDFNQTQLSGKIDNAPMYAAVAETYLQFGEGRHALIYCLTKKGCEGVLGAIRDRVPEEEWATVQVITGDTPSEERHDIEARFMAGEVKAIINCMVLTEGTDLPIADTIINARPTVNSTLYTQIVGRGTRLYDGKDHCLVLDIMPNGPRKLCSAFTLTGFEYQPPVDDDGEPINVMEKAEELEDMELRNSPMYLYAETVDILEEAIEAERETVQEAVDSGHMAQHLVSKLYDTGDETALDFHGIHYTYGVGEDERYRIRAGAEEMFTLSEPDVLHKVTVKAHIDGVYYRSEEPMDFDEAVELIRCWLLLHRGDTTSSFYWNESVIRSWADANITDKQLSYLSGLLYELGYGSGSKPADSKYEATVAIDFLASLKKHASELESAKKKSARYAELEAEAAALSEEEDALLLQGKAGMKELEKRKAEHKRQMMDSTIVYKPIELILGDPLPPIPEEAKNTTRSIMYQFTLPYNNESPATEKQIKFAKRLWSEIRIAGASADVDVDKFIENANTGAATVCIGALKTLKDNRAAWLLYRPEFHLAELFNNVQNLKVHVNEKYEITYTIR